MCFQARFSLHRLTEALPKVEDNLANIPPVVDVRGFPCGPAAPSASKDADSVVADILNDVLGIAAARDADSRALPAARDADSRAPSDPVLVIDRRAIDRLCGSR